MSGSMNSVSNRGLGQPNGPFEMQGLLHALSEASLLRSASPCHPGRVQVILELQARMQRLDAVRKTAIRAYRKFEHDLSDRLQSLRDSATRSWGWWNGEIMDQELMVAQIPVSGARLAAYRRSRERCLSIADWATVARQFVRGAVEELDALCEKQRVQFAHVEKRIADLRVDSIRERGAEVNIDDLLNGFQNVSIHMEEELTLPTVSQTASHLYKLLISQ